MNEKHIKITQEDCRVPNSKEVEEIEQLRSETISRLEKKGWEDAIRIVKRFDDPIDIKHAHDWSEKIDGMLQFGFIEAILD